MYFLAFASGIASPSKKTSGFVGLYNRSRDLHRTERDAPSRQLYTMGPKRRGYRARLQTLAIARQKKSAIGVEDFAGMCRNRWHDNPCD